MVGKSASIPSLSWDGQSKPQAFSWANISVHDIFNAGLRLDASVYATEAQQSKKLVEQCKYGAIPLSELTSQCSYPNRFKRAYVSKENGEKFFLPSQLNELAPNATKFLAVKKVKDLEALKITAETLLITRSGTIGNCTLANKTLIGGIFSDDVIRLKPKHTHSLGYIYCYLKSFTGHAILQSANYGAVIQHIEPVHLLNLPIPNAPELLKTHIHHTITESFNLRDESNELIEKAHSILQAELALPRVERLNPSATAENNLNCFSVSVANLNQRFEANYHHPLVHSITQHLKKHAAEVLPLGDKRITKGITLPGRYKRFYVDKKQGVPFLGGKEILELDPRGDKYLSLKQHGERIANELTLEENTILVTRSGTIGKVNMVPKHWKGWAGSEHLLRAVPSKTELAGYLYAWLSSEWALPLIRRHTYGAVVFEIDQYHLAEVPVPLLADKKALEEINNLVLKANELRHEAFLKEQEALNIFNKDVLDISAVN